MRKDIGIKGIVAVKQMRTGWHMLAALFMVWTVAGTTWAQTPPTARWYYEPQYEPPERLVDMLHMRLELSLVPAEGLVRATVTHRFTPLRQRVDSIFFNGPRIRILAATYNGKPARFTTDPEGIVVYLSPPATWDRTDSITFRYEANPRRGLYFIGWNDTSGTSRKQIWSQGQGIDNRHWFPCHDEQNDKLTTETIITFDSHYRVLSNGALVSETRNPDHTTRWHYRMSHPQSSYLVMLGIGEYGVEKRRSASGVPLSLYYYPEYPDRVEPTYRYSAEAVDFLDGRLACPIRGNHMHRYRCRTTSMARWRIQPQLCSAIFSSSTAAAFWTATTCM
jgi:aminopeptidase N